MVAVLCLLIGGIGGPFKEFKRAFGLAKQASQPVRIYQIFHRRRYSGAGK
jgi:hypothetical protein